MLELDVRIKKCKYCGKYFILKGNYKVNYCDRLFDGKNTCQMIVSRNNYAIKVDKNPAIKLYNRYYKKLYARNKVGTLKDKAFKKWKYEAVVQRGRCLEGEISYEEFEEWLGKEL